MSAIEYKSCTLCPRECKADRTKAVGFCGMKDKIYAAKVMVHTGEEPCISGTRGSGAIFFSGCTLRCAFCQNYVVSHNKFGKEIGTDRLSDIMLELQEKKVHNINLVSGTHFLPSIEEAADKITHKLKIPIVWNTGGYEKAETVDRLSHFCRIFLQDLKFYSDDISGRYAQAKNYFDHAIDATYKMTEKVGVPKLDHEGVLQSGIIVRHLILPSCRHDSIKLLHKLKECCGTDNIILSLMSQYTPPAFTTPYKELGRRLTDFEYKSVCETALDLGFRGYFQERESASSVYTPDFNLSGI